MRLVRAENNEPVAVGDKVMVAKGNEAYTGKATEIHDIIQPSDNNGEGMIRVAYNNSGAIPSWLQFLPHVVGCAFVK